MASEDFSYMLKEKPGAYIWLGAGNPGEGKMLHNSYYDFNDEIFNWCKLLVTPCRNKTIIN